jgi:non-canonical purine NTP pyrophosphatase (RdgB/HAM1 family)
MTEIIFISENVSKFKEIENYILKKASANSNITIKMIKPNYELQEIQSMDRTEIVLKKLRDALTMYRTLITSQTSSVDRWIMVEDTSLFIDKLGGFPGPFIKFFLQSMPLELIVNANLGSNVKSYVSLAICKYEIVNDIFNLDGCNGHVFEYFIEGVIVEPRGKNGFGFDPIFKPIGSDKTYAEMSIDEKELYNPRTLAFKKVLNYLEN